MLRPGREDEEEEQNVRLLESARGWAIAGLGLSISSAHEALDVLSEIRREVAA